MTKLRETWWLWIRFTIPIKTFVRCKFLVLVNNKINYTKYHGKPWLYSPFTHLSNSFADSTNQQPHRLTGRLWHFPLCEEVWNPIYNLIGARRRCRSSRQWSSVGVGRGKAHKQSIDSSNLRVLWKGVRFWTRSEHCFTFATKSAKQMEGDFPVCCL